MQNTHNVWNKITTPFARIAKSESGNALLLTGLVFPLILFAMIGGAIDYGRIYMIKSSLAQATTSTALAAGKVARAVDEDAMRTMAQGFYRASMSETYQQGANNMATGHIEAPDATITVTERDAGNNAVVRVRVDSQVTVGYIFLRLLGFTQVTITDRAEVRVAADNLDATFMADNFPGTFPDYNNKGYQLSSLEYIVDQVTAGDPINLRIGNVPNFLLTPKAFGNDDLFYPSIMMQLDPIFPFATTVQQERDQFRTWLRLNYSWEPMMYLGRWLTAQGGAVPPTVAQELGGVAAPTTGGGVAMHPSRYLANGDPADNNPSDYAPFAGTKKSFLWTLPRFDLSDSISWTGLVNNVPSACTLGGRHSAYNGAFCFKPDYLGFGVYTQSARGQYRESGGARGAQHGKWIDVDLNLVPPFLHLRPGSELQTVSMQCLILGGFANAVQQGIAASGEVSGNALANFFSGLAGAAATATIYLPCAYALAAPQEVDTLNSIMGADGSLDNWPRVYMPMGPLMLLATAQLAAAGDEPTDLNNMFDGGILDGLGKIVTLFGNVLTSVASTGAGFLPNVPLGDSGASFDIGALFPNGIDFLNRGVRKVLVMMPNNSMGFEVLGYHTHGGANDDLPAAWYNNRTEEITSMFSYLGGGQYLNNPFAVCSDIKQGGVEIYAIDKRDPNFARDAANYSLLTILMGKWNNLPAAAERFGKTRAAVIISMLACASGPGFVYRSNSAQKFTYFSTVGGRPADGGIMGTLLPNPPEPENNMADTQHKANLDRFVNNLMTVSLIER